MSVKSSTPNAQARALWLRVKLYPKLAYPFTVHALTLHPLPFTAPSLYDLPYAPGFAEKTM